MFKLLICTLSWSFAQQSNLIIQFTREFAPLSSSAQTILSAPHYPVIHHEFFSINCAVRRTPPPYWKVSKTHLSFIDISPAHIVKFICINAPAAFYGEGVFLIKSTIRKLRYINEQGHRNFCIKRL